VHQLNWVKVALPIGISFFTFETLTYSIDAYRGIIKPLKKLSDYYLYIFLFPKLIAGPIVRFNLIEDQIQQRHANDDAFILGFYRFVIGLSKKILIANTLGAEADRVFGLNALQLDSGQAWSGILAYTFQIYFDFSGYSDMALGIGRMIGFRFPENFDNPYNSASITEFWRRWHMTLGMWMREYLYIPLGGNKVSTARLYFNLWLVFLLSGLWHGASWNFVAWGAFHGTFLVLDRIFLLRVLERIGKIPAVIFTFFIVVNGWVLFRIEDFSKAGNFFKALYSFHFAPQARGLEGETVLAFVFATFFSFFCLTRWGKRVQDRMYDLKLENYRAVLQTSVAVVLFILCLSWITTTGFNPFIYYRF
jgi:alginate O-acetyltransferase complex protein AlgI